MYYRLDSKQVRRPGDAETPTPETHKHWGITLSVPVLGVLVGMVLGWPPTSSLSRTPFPRTAIHICAYCGLPSPSYPRVLCARDPEFGRKLPLALRQESGFPSNFMLAPDEEVLAVCPFHERQLDRGGRVSAR